MCYDKLITSQLIQASSSMVLEDPTLIVFIVINTGRSVIREIGVVAFKKWYVAAWQYICCYQASVVNAGKVRVFH